MRALLLKRSKPWKMERDEKRKKFHDALLKIYLPPSSPPPKPKPKPEQQIQSKEEESLVLEADLEGGTVDDVERVSSPGSDRTSDDDSGSRKLSRAQRKRIRKRKLKEAESSASMRKIIGPLLPFGSQVSADQEMPSKDENC